MKPVNESRFVRVLLSIFLILASLLSFNQVVYHDINPDTTISENNGHYDLDFISDDSIDFKLRLRFIGTYGYGEVAALINNDSCFVSGFNFEGCYEGYRYILYDTINYNDTGGNYGLWYDHQDFNLAFAGSTFCMSGPFMGRDDSFLGLKWIYHSIPYVCWVRLDVANDASWFTVKDYAYGPYTVIAGSQTSTSLNELINKELFQVYRNENNIIVKTKDDVNLKQCKLLNLQSQEFPIIVQNDELIIYNQRFSPGLYLLYLSTDHGTYTIKIIIN